MEIRGNDPVLPALAAMAGAAARFDDAAGRVASGPGAAEAPVDASVVQPVTYAANARVVRTATETHGSLIDALAY